MSYKYYRPINEVIEEFRQVDNWAVEASIEAYEWIKGRGDEFYELSQDSSFSSDEKRDYYSQYLHYRHDLIGCILMLRMIHRAYQKVKPEAE